jgi:hypothetical protein
MAVLAVPLLVLASCGGDEEGVNVPVGGAKYKATLTAEWSSATHPDMFPNNPHFSPLIGSAHAAPDLLWREGGSATKGIEVMAETGKTSDLTSEVKQAIQNGDALAVVSGGGISTSPGAASVTFAVSPEQPMLSLVTMIAPSPDWFIGVNSVDLIEQGKWRERVEVDLFAYDAGTDSGATFDAADSDTSPKETITRLSGGVFDVRFGKLVLELQPE